MTYEQIEKEFEKQFLYTVVLGSTLNDGNALRWNVGDGKMPDIDKIKSFLKQSFIKYLKLDIERWKKVFDYHNDMSNERHSTMRNVARTEIKTLQAQIKELEV